MQASERLREPRSIEPARRRHAWHRRIDLVSPKMKMLISSVLPAGQLLCVWRTSETC